MSTINLAHKTRCNCSALMSDLPLENGNETPAWKTTLSIDETVCRGVSSESLQLLLGCWAPLAARNSPLLEGGCFQVQVWFWLRAETDWPQQGNGKVWGDFDCAEQWEEELFVSRGRGWQCLTGFFIYSATIRSHHQNLSTAFRAVVPRAP